VLITDQKLCRLVVFTINSNLNQVITAGILLHVTVCAFIDLQYIDKEGTVQSNNLLLILLTLLINNC